VLEGACTLLVVNAAHIKAVPGRKTDVHDAEWIATLLQHGLLRPSFIPTREQRELRDLTRTRTSLTDERTAAVNRIQKVLEDANITRASVATDIMGTSGRAILAALLDGTADAATMALLARGKLRRTRAALEQALEGRMSAHHRLLLTMYLEQSDLLDEHIARLSAQIAERLRPYEADLQRLETIPGVGRRTAEILAAEMGLEMSRFPTAGHLAAWAGMCPGNHESAGKRTSGQRRQGNVALRRALTEAAQAAARTKTRLICAVSMAAWSPAAARRKRSSPWAIPFCGLPIISSVRTPPIRSVNSPVWMNGGRHAANSGRSINSVLLAMRLPSPPRSPLPDPGDDFQASRVKRGTLSWSAADAPLLR